MGPGSIVLCRRRVPELLCPAVNVLVIVSSLPTARWLRERAEPRAFPCCWSQPKKIHPVVCFPALHGPGSVAVTPACLSVNIFIWSWI